MAMWVFLWRSVHTSTGWLTGVEDQTEVLLPALMAIGSAIKSGTVGGSTLKQLGDEAFSVGVAPSRSWHCANDSAFTNSTVRVDAACFVYTCRRLMDLSNDCRYTAASTLPILRPAARGVTRRLGRIRHATRSAIRPMTPRTTYRRSCSRVCGPTAVSRLRNRAIQGSFKAN